MHLKPIRTKLDYEAALKLADGWWDASAGSPKAELLDMVTLLIADYESRHFPIDPPDPVKFIECVMAQSGVARKYREPFIGSRVRVAEVLNRLRPLSLDMIRKLNDGLNFPADLLVRKYGVRGT